MSPTGRNKRKILHIVYACFLWLLLLGNGTMLVWMTQGGLSLSTLLMAGIYGTFFTFVVLYLTFASSAQLVFPWNQLAFGRFVLLLAILLAASYGALYLPFFCVPFGVVGIFLMATSGPIIACVVSLLIALQMTYLAGMSMVQLAFVLVVVLLGICLFASLSQKKFPYVTMIFADILLQACLYAIYLLCVKGDVTDFMALADDGLYVAMMLAVSFVLLCILMARVHVWHYKKDNKPYIKLCNTEHPLLLQLKSVDPSAYMHAIHAAYLAERMAESIEANAPLSKAAGYYHRIGRVMGADTPENTLAVAKEYKFPLALTETLAQYNAAHPDAMSKEAAIVQLADLVVNSVTYMFQNNPTVKLDYAKVISVIIRKKLEQGAFSTCALTLDELYCLQEKLIQESLYYDFLR